MKPGSSPLARGLQDLAPSHGLLDRIIPARAGFTAHRPSCGGSGADHPRSRGVYVILAILMLLTEGSSPLARGLQ